MIVVVLGGFRRPSEGTFRLNFAFETI